MSKIQTLIASITNIDNKLLPFKESNDESKLTYRIDTINSAR